MTKPGIHRATANSKHGRRMISPGVEHRPWSISPEILAWNEQVEAKKLAKLKAKIEKGRAA